MKRFLSVVMLFVLGFGVCRASEVVYNQALVNEAGLAYDKNYTLDLNTYQVDYLSFQAVYSSRAYASTSILGTGISAVNDTINVSTAYPVALPLLYYSSGAVVVGLVSNTTYYAVPYSATATRLATSKANAVAGTVINISTAVATDAFTFTPLVLDGNMSFNFRGSNDGSNFYAINVTSITYVPPTAGSNYLWDLGFISYRYIRCAVVAPIAGAVNLVITGNGKRVSE